MKTFTATEQELIDQLRARGVASFSTQAGRKPTGGRCDYPNTRRINAACKLRDAGLVTIETERWLETSRGYGINGTDVVLRVTEAFKQQFN